MSTTGSTTRGSRLGGRAACAVTAAMALVLGGCGGSQEEPAAPTEDTVATSSPETVAGTTDAVPPTGTATSVPDEAAGTSAPASGEEDEPTDTAGADEPTDAPEPDAADYPAESIAYAREFLRAWSALDDARIAQLAVEEVTHGTDSWGVWGDLDVLESCELDPLVQKDGANADLAGLDLVQLRSGNDWLSVVLRRDSLGGEGAVVGVDLIVSSQEVAGLARAETPLDAYARSFVEAWVDEDLERMERLSSPEITDLAMSDRPALDTQEPHWFGFAALEGDPVEFYVSLPHPEEVSQVSDVVWVDPSKALAGEPHAVVGTNVQVDPRYMANCQIAQEIEEGSDG